MKAYTMIIKQYYKSLLIVLLTFTVTYWGEISKLEAYTESSVDLYDYVDNTLSYTESLSNAYVIPASADMTIFKEGPPGHPK